MSPARSLRWPLLVSVLALVSSTHGSSMFGEITSPGYPSSYPNEEHAEWMVGVPLGYRVRLHFRHFQLEASQDCVYDRLKVSSGGKTLGVFCGSDDSKLGNPPRGRVLTSAGNTMELEFHSDFSNEGKMRSDLGFLLYYEAIDVDECSVRDGSVPVCEHLCQNSLGSYRCACRHGYQLRDDGRTCQVQCQEFFNQVSGELVSPEYPSPYPPNLQCNYSIRVEEGFSIALEFQGVFEVEDHPEVKCPYDNVTIEYRNVVLGPLCGTQAPGPIETHSNAVDLLFHADESGHSRGWRLTYSTDRIQCPDLPPLDHGSVSPAQRQYRFMDRVSFSCDVGYKIMKIDRELSSFHAMCTKDGSWNKDVLATCEMIDCGEPRRLVNGRFRVLEGSRVRNGYQSRIQYSCQPHYLMESQGDGSYTCTADRRWINRRVSETIPYCAPVCGKPEQPVDRGTARIFGGAPAPNASFPWQVYLRPPQQQGRGSGVLIDPRWVLTAAHVLWPKHRPRPDASTLRSYGVYLGDNDLEDLLASAGQPVESVHLHPGYAGDRHPQFTHDVALIKLAAPVTLGRHVVPACLPPAHSQLYGTGQLGYVAGWGVTQDQKLLNRLHYVGLPVAEQEKCRRVMDRAQRGLGREPLRLGPGMFCAGTGLGETDSCQGDSGGAFAVRRRDDDAWYVAGLVSWGVGCGRNGTYGVYTRVESYLPWIRQTMAAEQG